MLMYWPFLLTLQWIIQNPIDQENEIEVLKEGKLSARKGHMENLIAENQAVNLHLNHHFDSDQFLVNFRTSNLISKQKACTIQISVDLNGCTPHIVFKRTPFMDNTLII